MAEKRKTENWNKQLFLFELIKNNLLLIWYVEYYKHTTNIIYVTVKFFNTIQHMTGWTTCHTSI